MVTSSDSLSSDNCPIFVVGPSRSGTALVRSILNGHSEIHLTHETHYFDDLRTRFEGKTSDPLPDARIRECQDYFLALSHRPYGHQGDPAKSRLSRDRLAKAATDLGGSADAYFEAYCRLEAVDGNARIWGEKTPRHVFRIADLLALYPHARVICLVRDPRAVVASYRDWKNQGGFDLDEDPGHRDALQDEGVRTRKSYHPLIIALLWNAAMRASREAARKFGQDRVRLVKYEKLACEGDLESRSLADWLSIPYQSSMTRVPMHNSSVTAFKKDAGISRAPVDRWREVLSPTEVGAIEWCCASEMSLHGYERQSSVSNTMLGSCRFWGTLPIAAARAVRANRDRIGNLPAYVARRLGVARGA